jgi:hypothetical protein
MVQFLNSMKKRSYGKIFDRQKDGKTKDMVKKINICMFITKTMM